MILSNKLFFRYICLSSIALLLPACVVAGPKTAANDNTMITSAMNNTPATPKVTLNGDEQAISQKITADPNASTLNWKNEATGSRGTMSILNNFVENGVPCRNFKTTRESFDGIMVYEGKACQQDDASWDLLHIKAL